MERLKCETHNQQGQLLSGYQRLEKLYEHGSISRDRVSILEAVRMMLPPVRSFPLDGLVFCIADEPYLTARKTLDRISGIRLGE
jgi:hypothetical protein